MKLRAMADNVILKLHWLEDQQYPKTELIVLPENIGHHLTPWGEVVAIGPHCAEGLKRGDKVKFYPYDGIRLTTNTDAPYIIIQEHFIEAVFDVWPEHAVTVEAKMQEIAEVG